MTHSDSPRARLLSTAKVEAVLLALLAAGAQASAPHIEQTAWDVAIFN